MLPVEWRLPFTAASRLEIGRTPVGALLNRLKALPIGPLHQQHHVDPTAAMVHPQKQQWRTPCPVTESRKPNIPDQVQTRLSGRLIPAQIQGPTFADPGFSFVPFLVLDYTEALRPTPSYGPSTDSSRRKFWGPKSRKIYIQKDLHSERITSRKNYIQNESHPRFPGSQCVVPQDPHRLGPNPQHHPQGLRGGKTEKKADPALHP